MKNKFKALTILMTVLCASATLGCSTSVTVEEHDDKIEEVNIEVKSNSNITSNIDSNSNTESNSNVTSNKTSNKISNKTSNKTNNDDKALDFTTSYTDYGSIIVTYKKYNVNQGETFSVLKAYDAEDEIIWQYTTKTVADPQFPIYNFLGGENDVVFLKENKDVIVLDIKNGKEKTRLKDVGYAAKYIGQNDSNLYFVEAPGLGAFASYLQVYDESSYKKVAKVTFPEKYQYMEFITSSDSGGYKIEFFPVGGDETTKPITVYLDLDLLKQFGCKIEK